MFGMRILGVLLFSIGISVAANAQGKVDGFFPNTGSLKTVLGLGFEDSKKYLAGNSKLDLERSTYYAAIFAAYGITERLEASMTVPYISSNKQRNFQDISLFLKYKGWQVATEKSRWELSAAAGFSTPLSNYDIGGLNDIGQRATVLETRAIVHYMNEKGWFGTLQSGFSFKFEEVPNSLPATLKVGRATSQWYYDVFYDYQHAFGGIDYRGTPRPQNFREFGVTFHKVGGTVYKPFSNSLGAYIALSYTFDGRNTFLGPTYGIGLSYQTNFK